MRKKRKGREIMEIRNIPFSAVKFTGGFWKARYDLNRKVSVKSVYERFEETGRFDALRFDEKKDKPLHIFYDSDAAKWIEAVAYLIEAGYPCKSEQRVIDSLVKCMQKHALENGYINSYFIRKDPEGIFRTRNNHELYCAGHLIEAAIAYDRATGKHDFLELMKKYVECIEKAFVIDKTAAFTTPGHEEIELALYKLYEYAGDEKYRALADFFVDERGKRDEQTLTPSFNHRYEQAQAPARELCEAEGHAVRATYFYTAMSDYARINRDEKMLAACKKLFANITDKRMYITGGIGSSRIGECFTVPYDLPNVSAYSESCAALGLMLFALSMQRNELNAAYGDVIEREMYNNMLSSTSLDGKAFFYENPLEIDLSLINSETSITPDRRTKYPITHRLEVFGCSCCPPNINRIFARLGDFVFSESGDALVVNQYLDCALSTDRVNLKISSAFPNGGKVKIAAKSNTYSQIYLRRPSWCREIKCAESYVEKDGYLVFDGKKEFEINVEFVMKPRFVEANPLVSADCGKVALTYGPTVYCLERIDNPYPLSSLSVDVNRRVSKEKSPRYRNFDLVAQGYVDEASETLYRDANGTKSPVKLTYVPYYTFANRENSDMAVWIRKK